ncbi:hypothetical protein D3C76_1221230 [compost metagenome]
MSGERASKQKMRALNNSSNWAGARVSQSTSAQAGRPSISTQVSSRRRTVMKPMRVRVKSSECSLALQNSDSFSIQSLHVTDEGSFYAVQPQNPMRQ